MAASPVEDPVDTIQPLLKVGRLLCGFLLAAEPFVAARVSGEVVRRNCDSRSGALNPPQAFTKVHSSQQPRSLPSGPLSAAPVGLTAVKPTAFRPTAIRPVLGGLQLGPAPAFCDELDAELVMLHQRGDLQQHSEQPERMDPVAQALLATDQDTTLQPLKAASYLQKATASVSKSLCQHARSSAARVR